MTTRTADELVKKTCVPCEGGVPRLSTDDAAAQVARLQGWRLVSNGQRIRKEWLVQDFMAGMSFFSEVADLAEQEGHHPDLHLEGYRNVAIESWPQAISGLSENDVILAAKPDPLPVTWPAS